MCLAFMHQAAAMFSLLSWLIPLERLPRLRGKRALGKTEPPPSAREAMCDERGAALKKKKALRNRQPRLTAEGRRKTESFVSAFDLSRPAADMGDDFRRPARRRILALHVGWTRAHRHSD